MLRKLLKPKTVLKTVLAVGVVWFVANAIQDTQATYFEESSENIYYWDQTHDNSWDVVPVELWESAAEPGIPGDTIPPPNQPPPQVIPPGQPGMPQPTMPCPFDPDDPTDPSHPDNPTSENSWWTPEDDAWGWTGYDCFPTAGLPQPPWTIVEECPFDPFDPNDPNHPENPANNSTWWGPDGSDGLPWPPACPQEMLPEVPEEPGVPGILHPPGAGTMLPGIPGDTIPLPNQPPPQVIPPGQPGMPQPTMPCPFDPDDPTDLGHPDNPANDNSWWTPEDDAWGWTGYDCFPTAGLPQPPWTIVEECPFDPFDPNDPNHPENPANDSTWWGPDGSDGLPWPPACPQEMLPEVPEEPGVPGIPHPPGAPETPGQPETPPGMIPLPPEPDLLGTPAQPGIPEPPTNQPGWGWWNNCRWWNRSARRWWNEPLQQPIERNRPVRQWRNRLGWNWNNPANENAIQHQTNNE